MSISAGSLLLGRYEILSPLGAGGMGEVYRAKDLRLGRDVAIKALPEHLASNHDALSRFEREAKAVAALSHPNILAIHDFGSDNDISFAVMELLEGETLRQRIKNTPMTWRKALEIAIPIADGLSAAHSRGVIHRDIKPENIFLTADEAIDQSQKAYELLGDEMAVELYANAHGAEGFNKAKKRIMELDLEFLAEDSRRYISPGNLRRNMAELGQKESAFDWLEKAYQDRSRQLAYLKSSERLGQLAI